MSEANTTKQERILIIGRSPNAILEAADILRSKGFQADATNQFDQVLTEYDATNLDVVVFGGMVPPSTKQHLRDEISQLNGRVTFVQGLAGIPGVIAAQVEGAVSNIDDGEVAYDSTARTVRLALHDSTRVVINAWWATSFTPPEPTNTSTLVIDSVLDAGDHVIPLPAEVPDVASYVTVSTGSWAQAFTVGAMPDAVMRMVPGASQGQAPALPPVGAVSTHRG